MEVGGLVGLPQTPLALLFLPGQFDNIYVKKRISTRILPVGTSQTGAVYILDFWTTSFPPCLEDCRAKRCRLGIYADWQIKEGCASSARTHAANASPCMECLGTPLPEARCACKYPAAFYVQLS